MKVAVAIVHGVGKQNKSFANGIADELRATVSKRCGGNGDELAIRPVHWAPALQEDEDALWKRVKSNGARLDFETLREFMIDFAADAVAYQPTPTDRRIYDAIHHRLASALRELADEAGGEAPLCVIAHSLGSVIASNYFYDLQNHDTGKILIAPSVKAMCENPLECGQTLAHFYTLGSPIAIWSLRYENFGQPIEVPVTWIKEQWSGIGEWVNFYDRDDVIAYPLSTLNKQYGALVKDRQVNVGGIVSSWNPMSHMNYWTDNDITKPIAKALARTWKVINGQQPPAP